MRAFVSWSGGKETALACHRVMRGAGAEVGCLLNMVSEDGKRSRSHGVASELVRLQAEAIGLPIVQRKTTWDSYEAEFINAAADLKKEGFEAGVFGDIDIEGHREWVERVCASLDIKPILPLWQSQREELLREFIDSGFEAVVVAVKADVLGEEWLGRRIDDGFINEIKKLAGVDPCGENGEYHTFVLSGPIFKKAIKITKTEKIKIDNHWFLNPVGYEIIDKD